MELSYPGTPALGEAMSCADTVMLKMYAGIKFYEFGIFKNLNYNLVSE